MKQHLLGLIVLGAIALIVWFAMRSNVPHVASTTKTLLVSESSPSSSAKDNLLAMIAKQGGAEVTPPRDENKPTLSMPSGSAPQTYIAIPQPPDPAALVEIDKVRLMLRDYRTVMDENPVGTNA